MSITYDSNFKEMQEKFGARPGDYLVDPYYFRKGIADKPYWWDHYNKKWRLMHPFDKFDFDDDGIMVRVDA